MHTEVSGVFDVRNVFQLIVHRLNDKSLFQDGSIPQGHELFFHVLSNRSDQLNAFVQQLSRQCFADVAFVTVEFAKERVGHFCHRFSVIHIALCQFQRYDFTYS